MEVDSESVAMKAAQKRKKKCLLVNRGAMSTIGLLFLVTIALVLVTEARLIENKDNRIRSAGLDGDFPAPSDDVQISNVLKRNIEKKQSLNDLKSYSDPKVNRKHQKLNRRQQGFTANPRHQLSDGVTYYFQGYRCEPIRKPKQDLRPGRKRDCQSLSSTIFCLSSFTGR